jgi:hypothetical protein
MEMSDKPKFIPEVGTAEYPNYLVVDLPGERVRARIAQVADEDTVVVELIVATMGKNHRYHKGDFVPVRRKQGVLEEMWEAVDERQLAMAENMARFERERARKEEEEAAVAAEVDAAEDEIVEG